VHLADPAKQPLVLERARRALPGLALVVGGRRHAQGAADRLDPEAATVLLHVAAHFVRSGWKIVQKGGAQLPRPSVAAASCTPTLLATPVGDAGDAPRRESRARRCRFLHNSPLEASAVGPPPEVMVAHWAGVLTNSPPPHRKIRIKPCAGLTVTLAPAFNVSPEPFVDSFGTSTCCSCPPGSTV
jgi:hypothetical protein